MFFRHGFRHGQAVVGTNTIDIAKDDCVKSRALLRYAVLLKFAMMPGILMFGMVSTTAFAQIEEGAAIKIGDSNLTPTVRFDYLQISNAFLTENDETEATAFLIKPRAEWTADRRLLSLTGVYEGEYASYSETALNYADHTLRAAVDAELSARQRILARVGIDFGHESLGTSFTRGNTNPDETQVEFVNSVLAGSYTYGADNARGNFTLGVVFNARSYQNREDLTEGSDFTSVRPSGQFSLRISPDTRAVATVRFNSIAFDDSFRDRNDISLLAGLRFAATGKFGGEFQLGSSLTNFSEASRTDQTSFIAEAELFYIPSVFSRFELSGSRELDNEVGSPLDLSSVLTITDTVKLNWRHEWSSRLFHEADLSYRLVNGDCPDRNALGVATGGIELNFVLRRWLQVGAGFNGRSRDITLCENSDRNEGDVNYESQTIGAHIRATL